jgi:hypothetical protein
MMNDDYEYFTESVSEQLILIFWTSFVTMSVVGFILLIAL